MRVGTTLEFAMAGTSWRSAIFTSSTRASAASFARSPWPTMRHDESAPRIVPRCGRRYAPARKEATWPKMRQHDARSSGAVSLDCMAFISSSHSSGHAFLPSDDSLTARLEMQLAHARRSSFVSVEPKKLMRLCLTWFWTFSSQRSKASFLRTSSLRSITKATFDAALLAELQPTSTRAWTTQTGSFSAWLYASSACLRSALSLPVRAMSICSNSACWFAIAVQENGVGSNNQ
mmetsp:Transcript_17629/g.54681  ORF Transcript_17629/g.54681 Transcript_17629/m.54681 type:complete len:233 (+) Transcript_17629:1174-1872(+)